MATITLLVLPIVSPANGFTPAHGNPQKIVDLLEQIKETYHVFFAYDVAILEGVIVDFELKEGEKLEDVVDRLMTMANLGYEMVGKKYCVIYTKNKVGLRKKRKLRRKFEQIQKLEKSGDLVVESSPGEALRMVSRREGNASGVKSNPRVVTKLNFSAAVAGEIYGTVTDGLSGDGLPSATVLIQGTTIGTAADLDGNYRLTNVPPGTHSLLVSYIGYQADTLVAEVADGQSLELNIELNPITIIGQLITVTSQRQGQAAAINQQVKANSIINVVSAERIQELPDENAAESVGRLPGISVSRSGGEGQRVNIRGLSPKFSSVTVDGVKIPATGQGRRVFSIAQGGGQPNYVPSLDDRSVDLSMISSEALAGIEVYKSLTPDQDGDAIGGKVNFITRKAPAGSKYRVNAQIGRNHFHQTTENVKVNGVYSNRLFDDKLGIITTAGFSTVDRSSDEDEVDYEFRGGTTLNGLTTFDNITTRDRYNGSVVFDYAIGDNHEFVLSAMYARTDLDNRWRNNRVGSLSNSATWSAGRTKSNINLLNLSLGSEHTLPFVDLDWKVNYVQTEDENPFSYGYGFGEPNPLTNVDLPRQDPYLTMEYTNFDAVTATGAIPGGGANNRRLDQNWIAQVNAKKPFRFSPQVNGYFKVGGKLQSKDRSRRRTNGTRMQSRLYIENYLADHPESVQNRNGISAANFLDESSTVEPFFEEKYPFPLVLDTEAPRRLFEEYRHLRVDELISGGGDYEAFENIYAGYLMTDLSLGRRVSVVGGVRYEHSDNEYGAYDNFNYNETLSNDGRSILTEGRINWVTSTQNYGEWLPMVNTKFKILGSDDNSNGLDLRLAATRTITRPDYYNLTPFQRINARSSVITRSEPTLLPTLGWNYDAFLTIFNNKFGLFTVGGFYKELENIDFLFNRILESDLIEQRFASYDITGAYSVIEPINATGITTVKGFELELQTNLSFLPSPFDGIVLYGNFSKIESEAVYPFRLAKFNFDDFTTELVDTFRTLQMPGQSDEIANVSVGYDKGRFSGRVSWNLQGPSLAVISSNEELDVWVDEFSRIDISLNFRITKNFTLIGSVTNLQNTHDRSFTGTLLLPGRESIFGTTSWLGIRYTGGSE